MGLSSVIKQFTQIFLILIFDQKAVKATKMMMRMDIKAVYPVNK